MVGRFANASIRTAVLGAAVALAPPALAERDLGSQAACLNKQMRKQGGGEAGRTAALLAHFECFPDTPLRFSQLFEGAGPLAGYPDGHFELFFAARGAVPEREWSDKAVAVLAGGEWRGGALRAAAAARDRVAPDRPARRGRAARRRGDRGVLARAVRQRRGVPARLEPVPAAAGASRLPGAGGAQVIEG